MKNALDKMNSHQRSRFARSIYGNVRLKNNAVTIAMLERIAKGEAK